MFQGYTIEIVLVGILCVALGAAVFLQIRNVALRRVLATKKQEIDEASRMLIGKNLDLNDQNVKQQRLLESREDFIAIVSHQLRTPATEVKWGVGEIRGNDNWKLTSEQRVFIERLYMSSEWMVNLIDRLVKLVNFEHGPLSALFSPYAPDEAVKASAEQIVTLHPGKKLNLSFDLTYEGVLMSIDIDSLKMVVSNLVDNAFYYTPEGGDVVVSSEREKDGSLTVRVKDTGIGISKEKQKTMFVKFQRDKNAVVANEKGMGLGLYVVKKIIQSRGGTIGFETEEGTGTTFYFTIPSA